jgi:hypothetical protein
VKEEELTQLDSLQQIVVRLANSDFFDGVQSKRLRIEDVLTVWWFGER